MVAAESFIELYKRTIPAEEKLRSYKLSLKRPKRAFVHFLQPGMAWGGGWKENMAVYKQIYQLERNLEVDPFLQNGSMHKMSGLIFLFAV